MYTGTLDPASNRANWPEWSFELIDANTNDEIDASSYDISISVEDDRGCQRLSFTTDNGRVTFDGTRIFFTATVGEMQQLCAGRYRVLINVTVNGFTTPVMDAALPVIDGGQ